MCAEINACPFTLTNNSKSVIMVVNPNGQQAVYIKPKQTKVIDPTIEHLLLRYFYYEKLDFYVQAGPDFYKKYRLTESYCTKNYLKDNALSLSDIAELAKKPTDRLRVEVYEKPRVPNDTVHVH